MWPESRIFILGLVDKSWLPLKRLTQDLLELSPAFIDRVTLHFDQSIIFSKIIIWLSETGNETRVRHVSLRFRSRARGLVFVYNLDHRLPAFTSRMRYSLETPTKEPTHRHMFENLQHLKNVVQTRSASSFPLALSFSALPCFACRLTTWPLEVKKDFLIWRSLSFER